MSRDAAEAARSRRHLPSFARRGSPLAQAGVQRERLRALPLAREFDDAIDGAGKPRLRAAGIKTLQLNLGKLCNQSCRHCHVDAGPDRDEQMSRAVIDRCLALLDRAPGITTVDVTGGAPELSPHFRELVQAARERGRHVIDRCNLTVLETGRCADLPEFLAGHGVEVVASLPHYRAPFTDKQRGEGVFDASIRSLRRLNTLGYGSGRADRRLILVTNPVGAFFPASQPSLEREWKRELARLHGVTFDALYALTNMPISRYLEWLEETEQLDAYMQRLVDAFNPAAVDGVMCRTTLSVGWDGRLYDCDFNQMLELELEDVLGEALDLESAVSRLDTRRIATDRHCFGCTAGAGSSCGGATVT